MSTSSFFQSLTVMANGPMESKPVLKGLYLRFLEHENHLPISAALYAAVKVIGDIQVMEIKGASDAAQVIELPQEEENFHLVYQFMGKSVIAASDSRQLKSGQHIGCSTGIGEKLICQIDRGKTWMMFIGLSGEALRSVRSEFPMLADSPRSPLAVGYRQKHLFDKVQQLKGGSFSLDIKLNYYIALLIEQYQSDLSAQLKAVDNADIALYHKAATYIQQHYMERKLTRQRIADALCVSIRTLTRAFEGKQVTCSKAIQLARLHKARERLRCNDAESIDNLASELHFSDTPYFIECYTALFKISPEAERKRRVAK
ncbi:helix-turn-helix domain-containing protein [Parapedobacter sp.]